MQLYKWQFIQQDSKLKGEEYSLDEETTPNLPEEIKTNIESLIKFLYNKAKHLDILNNDKYESEENTIYGYEIFLNTMISKHILPTDLSTTLHVKSFRSYYGVLVMIELGSRHPMQDLTFNTNLLEI